MPQLLFPNFTLVTASAGAGKTHALSRRFLQLLLSENVPLNGLKNILAMTFTNNAATEMRKRILETLKAAALGESAILAELSNLSGLAPPVVRERSSLLTAGILDNYSDFQVRTIDSFFTSIFKASAVEFGSSPEFEIALNDNTLVADSFIELMKSIHVSSPQSNEAEELREVVGLIEGSKNGEDGYLWNPYKTLLEEIRDLHGFAARQTLPLIENSPHADIAKLGGRIAAEIEKLDALIAKLTRAVLYESYLEAARARDFKHLLGRAPLRKPNKGAPTPQNVEAQCEVVNRLMGEYAGAIAQANFTPYIRALKMLETTLARIGAEQRTVFIEKINKTIAQNLTADFVPELVVKLGERLNHFLIDEFQDTSPVQWRNISVLAENALAQGGSLYIVGDPKQSIYGFRGGDWRIMERMSEHDEFPAAKTQRVPLEKNYRSGGVLVNYVKRVFQHNPNLGPEYDDAAQRCGLSNFAQSSLPGNEGEGYVETHFFKKDEDAPHEQREIITILRDCLARGFAKRDIAILARTNKDILLASAWLDAEKILSFSHSSLDVRRRRISAEIISLLRFLDSPIDDLEFANFVLGESFGRCLKSGAAALSIEQLRALLHEHAREKNAGPLYVAFREKFPDVWSAYFERLFSLVGYLPLYDLISEAYKTFLLFQHFPAEQAALVKLLDAVSTLEAAGENSLKAFLEAAAGEDDDAGWNIAAPKNLDAVQLLTVHKSKGLQFPIVIALLRDRSGQHGKTYYPEETPNGLNILRITEKMAEKNERLAVIREQKLLKDRVDELNGVYVALTRAANELYVVGTYHTKEPKVPAGFFTGLPAALGAKGRGAAAATTERNGEPRPALLRFESPKISERIAPPEIISLKETRRGDRIHEIFSYLEYVGADVANDVKNAIRRCSPSTGEFPDNDLARILAAFFEGTSIAKLFIPAPDRKMLVEQDFAESSGALRRADRVVIDEAAVTVIDFKTGHDGLHGRYEEQVRAYMRLARAVFAPKPVQGLLAYVDLKKLVEVA